MTGSSSPQSPAAQPDNHRGLIITTTLLLAGFALPLYQWARFALASELYSYVLLIPITSVVLVWLRRTGPAPAGPRFHPVWTWGFAAAGVALLVLAQLHPPEALQNSLALTVHALVLCFVGACGLFLSRATLRSLAFPLAFLVFMAPLPTAVEAYLETGLQHGSAVIADGMFRIIGTPLFRDGMVFHLPGFTMQVAPECSGIHSTIALFITSLVAGALLLRSPFSRAAIALAVLPIALLRNGLRVTTIGELCVRISPDMIHSFIHTRGGPIFFVISLFPFTLVLYLLIKWERRRQSPHRPIPS